MALRPVHPGARTALVRAAIALVLAAAACSQGSKAPAPTTEEAGATIAASAVPQAGASSPQASTPAPRAVPALALEGEGLRLVDPATGAARPLPFGTGWAQAQAALAFRGTPDTGRNEECGEGPLDYAKWSDSLTLYGQDGKFVGWFIHGPGGKVTTTAGIAPGSTRRALENAYKVEMFESSFGSEFAAGKLAGVLDGTGPGARITSMWAGMSCNFD